MSAMESKFIARMREAVANTDPEVAHAEADSIIIEYLEFLGEDKIINLWIEGSDNWVWT
jgi:hypothetical protein